MNSNTKKTTNSAIILAGGQGLRMESEIPKQFLLINKKKILDYSIDTLLNNKNIDEIIIVCHLDWIESINYNNNNITIADGGETRTESVLSGLLCCNVECKKVVIHDSARPFINNNLINNGLKYLNNYDAAIPVIDVDDSLIEIRPQLKYLNRDTIKRIQTPQFFDYKKILTAHYSNKESYTDDLSILLEYFKHRGEISYKFFKGCKNNFKFTSNEDYKLAIKLSD